MFADWVIFLKFSIIIFFSNKQQFISHEVDKFIQTHTCFLTKWNILYTWWKVGIHCIAVLRAVMCLLLIAFWNILIWLLLIHLFSNLNYWFQFTSEATRSKFILSYWLVYTEIIRTHYKNSKGYSPIFE